MDSILVSTSNHQYAALTRTTDLWVNVTRTNTTAQKNKHVKTAGLKIVKPYINIGGRNY